MIYLDNKVGNISNSGAQAFVSLPKRLINKNNAETDSVSFSATQTNNKSKDDKRNIIIASVIGGLAIIGGIILLAKKGKKLPSNTGNGIKEGAEDISKKASDEISHTSQNHSTSPVVDSSSSEIVAKSKQLAEEAAKGKKELADKDAELVRIRQERMELEKNTAEIRSGIYTEANPKVEDVVPSIPKQEPASLPINDVDQRLNRAMEMFADKLALDPELKGKNDLIKETLSLMKEQPEPFSLREVLKVTTPENKEFIATQVVPAIMKNAKALDMEEASNLKGVLEIIKPETVDCLDKLAENAEKFNITNISDTYVMMRALTKENKDFAFNELFPYLTENAEKYKIKRGGNMAGYLGAITPENKTFMFNEAIPAVIDNMKKIGASDSSIPKIAKYITKENIGKFKEIAEKSNASDFKDEFGLFDAEKLAKRLQNDDKESPQKIDSDEASLPEVAEKLIEGFASLEAMFDGK